MARVANEDFTNESKSNRNELAEEKRAMEIRWKSSHKSDSRNQETRGLSQQRRLPFVLLSESSRGVLRAQEFG
jgi:hypothetical protein